MLQRSYDSQGAQEHEIAQAANFSVTAQRESSETLDRFAAQWTVAVNEHRREMAEVTNEIRRDMAAMMAGWTETAEALQAKNDAKFAILTPDPCVTRGSLPSARKGLLRKTLRTKRPKHPFHNSTPRWVRLTHARLPSSRRGWSAGDFTR